MPKKKGTEIQLTGGMPSMPSPKDFASILESESLSMAQKRRQVLEQLGLKGTRKKYASPVERKAASKERREKRKSTRLESLKQYGLEPKVRGPKMSKEERKTKRSERGKTKRGFLREMAKANPELAKKYGIDPSRFKL